jgi:hypothetical protein
VDKLVTVKDLIYNLKHRTMNSIIEQKNIKQNRRLLPYEALANPVGLSRTHRVIRIEKLKEVQFMNLCSQIRITEFKQTRAEAQRKERREKR